MRTSGSSGKWLLKYGELYGKLALLHVNKANGKLVLQWGCILVAFHAIGEIYWPAGLLFLAVAAFTFLEVR